MTIREKIISLGLSPENTYMVTLLIMEGYTIGAAETAEIVAPHCNFGALSKVVADKAMKVLDHKHLPAPMPPNSATASAVFGYDFSNDLP